MRTFLLLVLPALAARVAGEPSTPVKTPVLAGGAWGGRTVLASGEGCRDATDLTNTYALLRPTVTACLANVATTAPLVVDISRAGAVSVHIGDPTLDACLAKASAPSLGEGTCTVRHMWPRWSDPRSLPDPEPPADALRDEARDAAGNATLDAATLAARCAPALGAAIGTWKLEIDAEGDGRVRSVVIAPQARTNAAFEACLLDAAWAVRFPAAIPGLYVARTFRFE